MNKPKVKREIKKLSLLFLSQILSQGLAMATALKPIVKAFAESLDNNAFKSRNKRNMH